MREKKITAKASTKRTSQIPPQASIKDTTSDIQEDVMPYIAKPHRFIDLFCGIGGFRIAFEKAGAKCVFSSDYDKFSQQTYKANFGELPHGDINQIDVATIPAHDVLCAGFPCQPFSIAGVSKKNSLGRLHGFDDVKQGNLFFAIAGSRRRETNDLPKQSLLSSADSGSLPAETR